MSRLLICVDFQNDFLEGGSFAVPGGKADVERTINFISRNNIDKIICSLDTHTKNQIFFGRYWNSPEGNEPEPFTIITKKDVEDGKWIPVEGNTEYVLEYLDYLETHGKNNLCIWPYHCLIGTTGGALPDNLSQVVYKYDNMFIQKGTDRNTEMLGIIKPEYDKNGYLNQELLDIIYNYDEIFITGEAASHCVLESIKQIAEYYSDSPEVLSKITVLKDCMSAISGSEEHMNREFDLLKNKGIKFANSDEV